MSPKTILFAILGGIIILVFGGLTLAQVLNGAPVDLAELAGTIGLALAGLVGVVGAARSEGTDLSDTAARKRDRGFALVGLLAGVGGLAVALLLGWATVSGCTQDQIRKVVNSLKVTAEIVGTEAAAAGVCAMSCGLWDDQRGCYEGCAFLALGAAVPAVVDELAGLAPDLLAARRSGGLTFRAARPVSLLSAAAPPPPEGCVRRIGAAFDISVTRCEE